MLPWISIIPGIYSTDTWNTAYDSQTHFILKDCQTPLKIYVIEFKTSEAQILASI